MCNRNTFYFVHTYCFLMGNNFKFVRINMFLGRSEEWQFGLLNHR